MIALGKIEFGFVLVVDADVEIGIVKTLGLIIPTSCRSSSSRPFMRSSFTLCLKQCPGNMAIVVNGLIWS